MNANAEGRTYVSKKEREKEVKYQICRLSKTERTASSTSCYYKAQIPEDSIVVSTESPKTVCQREFACKIQWDTMINWVAIKKNVSLQQS